MRTKTVVASIAVSALAACSGANSSSPVVPTAHMHTKAALTAPASITEYDTGLSTSSNRLIGITTGSDGALYFSEAGVERIGRITTSGVLSSLPLSGLSRTPWFETTGRDGNLWITESAGLRSHSEAIARLTLNGVVTQFPLPKPLSSLPIDEAGPRHIVSGPDGNLWFVERSGYVGRMTTTGVLTRFPIPTPDTFPSGIAVGSDGALWFTESLADKIGRITTSGTITEYQLPTSGTGTASIAPGPDGNLWFCELFTDKVGRITPSGVVTEFSVTPGSGPRSIIAGPDGNLYYSEFNSQDIGRITVNGVFTDIPTPSANSQPWDLVLGPDHNIWFTEAGVNKIGKLSL